MPGSLCAPAPAPFSLLPPGLRQLTFRKSPAGIWAANGSGAFSAPSTAAQGWNSALGFTSCILGPCWEGEAGDSQAGPRSHKMPTVAAAYARHARGRTGLQPLLPLEEGSHFPPELLSNRLPTAASLTLALISALLHQSS